ncbi:uncharacterized protein BHQ10_008721 [Talaromyces amestolkiae]|uniref:Uncharacterized protein n=1 Tax=Talaromyces amestolkiae TaxID=1196081 RepID=A0A364LAA7_TALAM|nr:uncharacterized protein BHQ10_008721 [Talaromyces amestolkiae]RAO72709.1 hypothetical protein BHQ10_008721 [Talaromyces amestolkiae]
MTNPLLLPEVIETVMDHIDTVPDLLNCACVNKIWNIRALKRLYKGTLNDMRYRTPDIGSLNCLFVASRERFVRNMGFVKHLLLHPEKPLTRDAESGFATIVSGESCRALRHRRYAEALLQPEGGSGLRSLTIPFMIANQSWSPVISPSLEFLAVNVDYCSWVVAGCIGTLDQSSNQELLKGRLSHLKALTLYHCGGGLIGHYLYDMVACCDLEFFHFEDWKSNPLLSSDIMKLLTSLKTHHNLKALALKTNLKRNENRGMIASADGWAKAWPDLRALYLGHVDQNRLNEIVKFKKLEILSLNDDNTYHTDDNLYSIAGIATCKNLRVLDIWLRRFDTQEIIFKIAHSCPLLRRLSVRSAYASDYYETPDNNVLLSLLRILPHIEYLNLDWSIELIGDAIQELAVNCPNLTVLRLRCGRIFTSLAQLQNNDAFKRLEILEILEILFENSKNLMEGPDFPVLAMEWRRVFPKIRAVPCVDDIRGFELERRYQEKVRAGSIEEIPIREERPGHIDWDADREEEFSDSQSDDYDGNGSGQYKRRSYPTLLRLKLWEELDYERDKTIYDRVANKWQADFEIEKVGWPIVPLKAFGSENII